MAYSSFERSINARKQLRDRYGKWIYQGGSVKWFDLGSSSWKSGTVDSFNGDYVNIAIKGSGNTKVHRSHIESIPKKATLGGSGESYNKADFDAAPAGSTATIPGKQQVGTGNPPNITVTKNAEGGWSYKFSDGTESQQTYTSEELAQSKATIDTEAEVPTEGPKDISDWTAGKQMGGSNGAQLYTSPDGEEYVVKFPQSADHANNEVLASRLYDLAGIPTPSQELVVKDGKIGVSSPLVPGASSGFQDRLNDKDFIEKIQKGFAVDAWLANWDVAGLSYDNIVSDENDDAIRIDPGGALIYRAQGAPKGDKFGDSAEEWETLTTAPEASKIFGSMTDEQKQQSATLLTEITDEDIDRTVDSVDFSPGTAYELKSKLKARRDDIFNRAGTSQTQEEAPETTKPAETTIDSDSEYGKFLTDNGVDLDEVVPEEVNTKWFKDKFGKPMDNGDNPGWLDKSTGNYDLEPGDIVFGYMQGGSLLGKGKQKFIVSGSKNDEGQNLLYHLPKKGDKDISPGSVYTNGQKGDSQLKITSAIRPPQTGSPKPKEEKKVTVLTKDLPAVYSPKKGDWVSDTEGEGYFGTPQKWHIVLEDEPSKTNLAGNPVYMVSNANGPQNYAPDVYGINPNNIKAIQVSQERLDEIKNTPNAEQETNDLATPKSWFSPAEDEGENGDGYHESGPWGKFGAAGVMIQDQKTGRFLLVQRGPMVSSNKGKWQLPGGAINSKETPAQGAARETIEELKAEQSYLDTLEHKGDVIFDNGKGWQYTNITATAPDKFTPDIDGTETGDADWFSIGELKGMRDDGELHPAFAKTLDDLLKKFDNNDDSTDVVEVSEEDAKDLATPELDAENQETLDQIKDNLGIPKTSVESPSELDELAPGARINMYNTMFQENNYFTKTKDGKWWPDAFGPIPEEPKSWQQQDSEDLLLDGYIVSIESDGPGVDAPERRVSTGPTDLRDLPEGSVITFSGDDKDKTYTKDADGFFEASWLPAGHKNKIVTAEQIHVVASYLGKDVEVVNEQRNTPDVPEVKEMQEILSEEDELTIAEMDKVDSLEESVAGTTATSSVSSQIYTKQQNGFWSDEDGTQFTPNDLVDSYGTDLELTPPREENNEPSELKQGSLEDLYNDAGIDASGGNLNGLEEYLNVGDKVTFEGLADNYTATKQEDWSWTNDSNPESTLFYPGELDSQLPKNIISVISGDTEYKNNENSDSTSATSPQQDTSHSGEVVSTVNGINIDGDGNQWVPDKNGQPLYNGTVVKNKKGDLGKISFLQKGGKKVRVETPDGDTKFWNAHLVERTDEEFNTTNQKYGILVDDTTGEEYVTNANGDKIFVGDTVTSPGKAGFTGVVQGFKSNGQFVLVLDPADNKVKPRKTDKITVDESATPAAPATPEQTEESSTFNDGDQVKSGDFAKAPIGSKFHESASGAGFEKIDKNSWHYTPPGSPTPQLTKYNDSDMENTLEYGYGTYVWGPAPAQEEQQPEPMAQWEKELLGAWDDGTQAKATDVVDAPIGTTAHTTAGDGGYFKKSAEDNWQYYTTINGSEVPSFNFTDSVLQEAINTQKSTSAPYVWGLPAKSEESESLDKTTFSEGDKITDWQDLVDFEVGEYVNLVTGTHKAPYVKQSDGEFHNPVVGYSFTPAQFENAISEGDIEYGGKEYIDETTLEIGQKINGSTQFEKLVPGDTISVEGSVFDEAVTYEKLDNGDFKNVSTEDVFPPSAFNGAVNTSAVTYTGKKTETLNPGDSITNTDQLKNMKPGEFATSISKWSGNEYTYVKLENGNFQNPTSGESFSADELQMSINAGTLKYGGEKYETNETPLSDLKVGDKITSVKQIEDMKPGEIVLISPSYSNNPPIKYIKQENGNLKTENNSYGFGHQPSAFGTSIADGSATYGGRTDTEIEVTPEPIPETPEVTEIPSLPSKDGKKISVGATVNHPVKNVGGVISKIDVNNGDVWFKDSEGKTRKYKAKFLNVVEEAPEAAAPTPAGTASNAAIMPESDPNSPWYGQPAPQLPDDLPDLDKNFAVDGLYDEIAAGYSAAKDKDFSNSTYKNLFDQLAINGSLNIPANFNKNEAKYGEQKDILDFFVARGYLSKETADKARTHLKGVKEKNAETDKANADIVNKYNTDLYEWKIANGIPLSSFNPKTFIPSPSAEYIYEKRGSSEFGSTPAADKALPGELTKKDQNALKTWFSSTNESNPGDDDYVPSISWNNLSQQLRMAGAEGLNDLSQLDSDQKLVAQAIDDAVHRNELEQELVIVRGAAFKNLVLPSGGNAASIEDMKSALDSIVVDYGYFAASPQNSPGYAANHEFDFVVRMPKGSHAAWLGGKNQINPGESEILLPRGSRFHIRGIKNEGGSGWGNKPVVIADLVPEGWEPGMPSVLDSAPQGAPAEGGAPAAGGPAAGGGGPAV